MQLRFDMIDVIRALRHSVNANERKPTLGQQCDGQYRHDGRDLPLDEMPSPEDVNPEAIPPGLWFVKDEGIYLMSNGKGIDSPVVYAQGFDPRGQPPGALFDKCRAAVGGDDFAEFVPGSILANFIKEADTLILDVGEDDIQFLTEGEAQHG